MNKTLVRGVAFVLIPAIFLADPSWATFAARGLSPQRSGVIQPMDFAHSHVLSEAIVPLEVSGFRSPHGMIAARINEEASKAGHPLFKKAVHRLAMGLITLHLLNASPLVAQDPQLLARPQPQTQSATPSTTLPYSGVVQEVMRENKAIAGAPLSLDPEDNLWNLDVPMPAHMDQLSDYSDLVINNSNETAQLWLKLQSTVEEWFAAASPMKQITYGSDPNRELQLPLGQGIGRFNSDSAGAELVTRFIDLNAFQRVESASSGKPRSHGFKQELVAGLQMLDDLFLRGGIQGTSSVEIQKHYLNFRQRSTDIHIAFTDFEEAGLRANQVFQRTLFLRLDKTLEIREKQLEIELAKKRSAQHTSPVAMKYQDDASRQAELKIQSDEIDPLSVDLHKLQREAADLENALRQQLARNAKEQSNIALPTPRLPQFQFSKANLEYLANLRLPGDVDKPSTFSLPNEARLRESTQHLLGHPLRVAEAYDPTYVQALLNDAWQVPDYHQAVVAPALEFIDGKVMDPQQLSQLLPNDDSQLGLMPKEEKLYFQQYLLQQAVEILKTNKKSSFAWAIRFHLSAILPLLPEFNGTRIIDATMIDHQIASDEILLQTFPDKINSEYVAGLVEWQQVGTQTLERLENARLHAQALIKLYTKLLPELKSTSASTNWRFPAGKIAQAQIELMRDLIALDALRTQAYLLTPAGRAEMSGRLEKHFRSVMQSVDILKPIPSEKDSTVQPPDTTPAPPKDKHKKNKKEAAPKPQSSLPGMARMGVLAMAALLAPPKVFAAVLAPQFIVGSLHYWANPWLQLGTTLCIALLMVTTGVYENAKRSTDSDNGYSNGNGQGSKSFKVAHAFGAAMVMIFAPGPFWLSILFGVALYVLSRRLNPALPFKYSTGDLHYKDIHYLHTNPGARSWIRRVAWTGVVATSLWMLSAPWNWFLHRNLPSLGISMDTSALQINSEIPTIDVPLSVYPGLSGYVANSPLLRSRTHFKVGDQIVATRGPDDETLVAKISRANAILNANGLAAIHGYDELQSHARFNRAAVQIVSDAKQSSVEFRLDAILSKILKAGPQSAVASGTGNVIREGSRQVGTLASEEAHKLELTMLARAFEIALLERDARDELGVAVHDFELVSATHQLTRGAVVSSDKPVLLGKIQLRNVIELTLMTDPREALRFMEFWHTPNATMYFGDDQIKLHFRPQDVIEMSEPTEHHGLLPAFDVSPDSHIRPHRWITVTVQLPDNQEVPEELHALCFNGYSSGVPEVELTRDTKTAFATVEPNGEVFRSFTAPLKYLPLEINEIQTAIDRYQSFQKQSFADAKSVHGTDPETETRAIQAGNSVDASAQDLDVLRDSLVAQTDVFKNAGTTLGQTIAEAKGSLANTTYPVDPVAAAAYPLKAPYPGMYRTLGNVSRIHFLVDAADAKELSPESGQVLSVSMPGSTQTFEVTFVRQQQLLERGMTAARVDFEVEVAANTLAELFPQVRYKGSPVGIVVVEVHHRDAKPQQSPKKHHAMLDPTTNTLPSVEPVLPTQAPTTAGAERTPVPLTNPGKTGFLALFVLPMSSILFAYLMSPSFIFAAGLALVFVSLWGGYRSPLGNRFRDWAFHRTSKTPIAPIDVASHANAPTRAPVILGSNGLPPTSVFQQIVGGGKINDGTVVENELLQTLDTRWGIDERLTIAATLKQGVSLIKDRSILLEMADSLHVSMKHFGQELTDESLVNAITETLIEGFDRLAMVRLQTTPNHPLLGVLESGNERQLYIDTSLLSALLLAKAPEDSLRTLVFFYYALGVRDLNVPSQSEENFAFYTPRQNEAVKFSDSLTRLVHYSDSVLAAHSLLTLGQQTSVLELRRKKADKKKPLHIRMTGREHMMGQVKMNRLRDFLVRTRLRFEMRDTHGKRRLDDEILYQHFRYNDVTPKLASAMAAQYNSLFVVKPKANLRTTFIAIMQGIAFIVGIVWVIKPGIVPAIMNPLVISNFVWALFYDNPVAQVSGVPPILLTIFLGVMIFSFFWGTLLKPLGELSATLWFQSSFGKLWFFGNPNRQRAEFAKLAGVSAFDFLNQWKELKELQDTSDFHADFEAYTAFMIGRVVRSLTNSGNATPIEVKRRVVSALYQYAEHPLTPKDRFFTSFSPMHLKSQAEIFTHLWPDVRLTPMEIHALLDTSNSDLRVAVEQDLEHTLPHSVEEFNDLEPGAQEQLVASLERKKFSLNNDWRRDSMDEVQLQPSEIEFLLRPKNREFRKTIERSVGRKLPKTVEGFAQVAMEDRWDCMAALYQHDFFEASDWRRHRIEDIHLKPEEIDVLLAPEQEAMRIEVEKALHQSLPTDAESFDHLSADIRWRLIATLYRVGFIHHDDWRRDRMEEDRIQYAIGEMLNAPTQAFLALLSRNLLGFAADPRRDNSLQEVDQSDMAREVLTVMIDRMRTMAPDLYMSYREYTRIAKSFFFIHYAIDAVRHEDVERSRELDQAFQKVLSNMEKDGSDPALRPFMEDTDGQKIDKNRAFLSFLNKWIEPFAPTWTADFKRKNGIIVTKDDPMDQLAVALMYRYIGPEYLERAVDAMTKILQFALYDRTKMDLDALIQAPDFYIFRKLSEQSDLPIKNYLEAYMDASTNRAKRAVLRDFLSKIKLSEGATNNLNLQESRRLIKSFPSVHDDVAHRLAPGVNFEDPLLYPIYLADRFLQDKQLNATTPAASLLQMYDEGNRALLDIIDMTSKFGPRPLGAMDILLEAAGDVNHRQSTLEMQQDAVWTSGNVYRVAVSRKALLGYMEELYRRLPIRVPTRLAKRLHTVMLEQVLPRLGNPSGQGRVLMVTPEIESRKKLVDNEKIADTDRVGLPNPYVGAIARLLHWFYMRPKERDQFLASLGKDRIRQIEDIVASQTYLLRSSHIEIHIYPQRWHTDAHTGTIIDVLKKIQVPVRFNVLWGVPADGFNYSARNGIAHLHPDAPLSEAA